MIDLTIDVEAKKDLLAQFVGDKLQVLGAILSVGNVSLNKVLFEEQDIPDKDVILQALRENLAKAQSDGLTWQNDIETSLAGVPQAVINYGTLFANALPNIRKLIKEDNPSNRDVLKQIFSGLVNSVGGQIETLDKIKESIALIAGDIKQDSDNFSENNQNFSQLEKIDEENLKEARAAIDSLNESISKYNKEITQKVIKAEEDLTIADIVISAGGAIGKAAEPVEALGLAVGLCFIISAGLNIQELSSEIDALFQAAMQEAKHKVAITQLTEQLQCLHVTSSGLKAMVSEVQDIIDTLQGIIDGWEMIGSNLKAAENQLDDFSQPLDQILSEFNLGRASAEWEEVVIFAQKMEGLNILFGKQKLVTPRPD